MTQPLPRETSTSAQTPQNLHHTQLLDYANSLYPPTNGLPTTDQLAFHYHNALATLLQTQSLCMNQQQQQQQQQNLVPSSSTACLQTLHAQVPSAITAAARNSVLRQDSLSPGTGAQDWQLFQPSMGGSTASTTTPVPQQGLKRSRRTHQRTLSASSIASTTPHSAYPYVANTDYSPNSPAPFTDYPQTNSKLLTPTQTPVQGNFLSVGYVPSQHAPSAHQAMQAFAIDHHTSEDFAPDFRHSSRQSMSSHGNNSPATPQSGMGENGDLKQFANQTSNGEILQYDTPGSYDAYLRFDEVDFRPANAEVPQLFRTESQQAYDNELFNPSLTFCSASPALPAKPASNYLSPHRSVMSQRLQTANNARSQSPTAVSASSRDRSPFRDGSPYAANGFPRSQNGVGTAAGMRQQQKEQAEQAELAQHRPQLNREPTKTISPKDALLDYNETDQKPLFHDSAPTGYKSHTGGVDQWFSQSGAAFGNLQMQPAPAQQQVTFRATSGDGLAVNDVFSFVNLPQNQTAQSQISNASFPAASYAGIKMNAFPTADPTPAFPATLASMESSTGSQNGNNDDNIASTTQRPADTRANTGSYTCTYHNCTQRFDSHANLQKHKREVHRSQLNQRDTTSNGSGSAASPGSASESSRSSASPDPSTAGMTSSAIMARNSQAGPHKCSRINPSTNKPCNTIFSRPYDLTRHEDTIHNGRKQKVRCPMCREEKTFSRNDALTRHMRVVHPEAESYGKRVRRD